MQDTVILCIDIWNYHHCISQIHKSNLLVNKIKPFLQKCLLKNIQVIHMHDKNLPYSLEFLRNNAPTKQEQNKYINTFLNKNNNLIKNFNQKINPEDYNIPIPKCGKTAICECDTMRSCFLKNHNYFKDKLEIYKNLIKNK